MAAVPKREESKRREPPLGNGGSQHIGLDFCGLQAACKAAYDAPRGNEEHQ